MAVFCAPSVQYRFRLKIQKLIVYSAVRRHLSGSMGASPLPGILVRLQGHLSASRVTCPPPPADPAVETPSCRQEGKANKEQKAENMFVAPPYCQCNVSRCILSKGMGILNDNLYQGRIYFYF